MRYLREALHAQWRRYRKRLKSCQKNFSTKAVHKSRVATRRLKAILDLVRAYDSRDEMGVKSVQRALKQHLDSFDRLRDTQMQLAYVTRLAGSFPAAEPLGDWLKAREEKFTKQTCKAIRHIKTKRVSRSVAVGEKLLRREQKSLSPDRGLAIVRRKLQQTFTRVCKYAAAARAEDTATIHRTRVAFKRFRYMVEALISSWPGITKEFCQELRGHQTLMGDIQDMEVLLAALDKFIQKTHNGHTETFRKELVRRRGRLIRNYFRAADGLNRFWPLPETAGAKQKESEE